MPDFETYSKFKIRTGELDRFKRHVSGIMAHLRKNGSKAIRYDWYLSEAHGEAVAISVFNDAGDIAIHIRDLLAHYSELSEMSDVSVEFLDMPSGDAGKLFSKYEPGLFTFKSGLLPVSAARDSRFLSAIRDKNKIEVYTKFKINPGEAGIFKDFAQKMLNIVQQSDPGTLRYDWFYDEVQNQCVVMDTYENPASMFSHMRHCNTVHHKLLEHATMATEFLGQLPGDAMEAVAKYNPYILQFYAGLV